MLKIFLFILISILIPSGIGLCDELSDIKSRLLKLEKKLEVTEKELNRQKEFLERVDEFNVGETDMVNEIEDTYIEEEDFFVDIPKLTIRGFADLGFNANKTDNSDSNSFFLGNTDLFFASKVSDRTMFIAETTFHFHDSDDREDEIKFELERVVLKYSISDILNIKIGRMHTPLGYWNQNYHHGSWLQTTIYRPKIYEFEDESGGLLPVHSVGLEMFGLKDLNLFDIKYNLGILNGRSKGSTKIIMADDENNIKAMNLLLGVSPRQIDGLEFGGIVYKDVIPPEDPPEDPPNAERENIINELIFGGYVVLLHNDIEILFEIFNINHHDKTLNKSYISRGLYLQGGYEFNDFVPYYRYDYINIEEGDPYYSSIDTDLIKEHTLGLRWNVFTWNALKFEYSYSELSKLSELSELKNIIEHSVAINSSFTF